MGFSKEQRLFVIHELQSMGWILDDDIIESPSGGVGFTKNHFEWSPEEMHEIIGNRGKHVARERHNGWEKFSEEHFQVCVAIEKMWESQKSKN